MSQQLIKANADLLKLRNDEYQVEVVGAYLVVRGVPYVTTKKEVAYGTLITDLNLQADKTVKPKDHTMLFEGETPCDASGTPLTKIIHSEAYADLGNGLKRNFMFSSKPDCGHYADFYEKMTTYAKILMNEAQVLDPDVSAKGKAVFESKETESVFQYEDTASTRAEIGAVTKKLQGGRIAIVGVGGTGAFILDQVAKTPVAEIHPFDGDKFSQHNAFRAPGAASIEDLRANLTKVAYYTAIYSKIHRHIIPHEFSIDASNVEQLRDMSFVFLCIDAGDAKKLIIQKLEEWGICFIDVGMGIQIVDGSLTGQLRVTTSTPAKRGHVQEKIGFSSEKEPNDYDRNIQVSDLNALNAILAVIRWKKLCGFYHDLSREHSCIYAITGNRLINEDKANEEKS